MSDQMRAEPGTVRLAQPHNATIEENEAKGTVPLAVSCENRHFPQRPVFFHAHPDDETLSTGALILELAERARVALVTATRGERGEMVDGPLAALAGTPELAVHRDEELEAACAVLGVGVRAYLGEPPARVGAGGGYGDGSSGLVLPHSYVGQSGQTNRPRICESLSRSDGPLEPSPRSRTNRPHVRRPDEPSPDSQAKGTVPESATPQTRIYSDSGMRWVTPTVAGPASDSHPGDLAAAPVGEAAADLAAFVAWFGGDALVSYDEDGGYGHPDHVACHRIAARAAALAGILFVMVVSPTRYDPANPRQTVWPLSHRLGGLRRALACYPSQFRIDGDAVVHPGGQRQEIVADVVTETYTFSGFDEAWSVSAEK